MKGEAEIITILGMRGCGKSTLTRRLSEMHPRKIIFDRMREWGGTHVVYTLDEFKNVWRENFHSDEFSIVVSFAPGTSLDNSESVANQVSQIVYTTGLQSGLPTCLIFEEAQFYFPNTTLPPFMFELLTTGRHAHCSVIANTQRPASVSKLLISQSSHIYIGQLFEMRDIAYLTSTVGEVASQSADLEKLEFLHYTVGSRQPEIVELSHAPHPENIP